VARYLELRRHTDNDGDVLSEDGVKAALEIGRALTGPYALLVSSGAQRATHTLACFACALTEPVSGGTIVEPELRSRVEDRWRAAYQTAGSAELRAIRDADPELVRGDSQRLAAGFVGSFDRLPDGARALAVGHSPTNEAAVRGLTGEIVAPISKGGGVLVAEAGASRVDPLG
jgi:broad specificity phosphatase PhoE